MPEDAKDLTPSRQARLADELREDLEVAIREFLERHPSTTAGRVRQAIRLVARGLPGRKTRLVGAVLALLAALGTGVVLGSLIG